jgi:hypothetical protein
VTRDELVQLLSGTFPDEEVLLADGFEDAFLGVTDSWGDNGSRHLRTVYSTSKAISVLETRDGMSTEEALEFFEFNVAGAYAGPQTPIWVATVADWEGP